MRKKIIDKYCELFNITNKDLLYRLSHQIDYEKLFTIMQEKIDITLIYNENNQITNVFFYEKV